MRSLTLARLDSLQIEIAPLLADRVVGEVVLEENHQPQGGRVRVPAGEKKSFVYDIGVEFSSADRTGFDVGAGHDASGSGVRLAGDR